MLHVLQANYYLGAGCPRHARCRPLCPVSGRPIKYVVATWGPIVMFGAVMFANASNNSGHSSFGMQNRRAAVAPQNKLNSCTSSRFPLYRHVHATSISTASTFRFLHGMADAARGSIVSTAGGTTRCAGAGASRTPWAAVGRNAPNGSSHVSSGTLAGITDSAGNMPPWAINLCIFS